MEKGKPSFDLTAFKAICGDARRLAITTTALKTAAGIGCGRFEIAAVIKSIKAAHFLKSMTSYSDHKRWQDVYHVPHEDMVIYLKFTDDTANGFVVLSFKER